jgi:hypothetical protein
VTGDVCGWKIYGSLFASGVWNPTNSGNRYNGPWNISDQDGAFLNQAWLTLEKTMGDKCALGGRVDVLFGNDYLAFQSRGFELNRNAVISSASEKWNTGADYGLAIPQAFVEFGTSKLSVVAGHFLVPLGYENAISATDFFNTRTYAFNFTEYTNWGALVKWNPNEHWSLLGGVVNGWDALDREQNSACATGSVKYTSCDKKWSLQYAAILGNDADYITFPVAAPGVFVPTGYALRYTHSIIFDAKLSDRLEYVLEHTFGNQAGTNPGMSACWYGINNELFWKLNDCWKLGGRFEWWRDNNGFIVGGFRDGNPNGGFYVGDFWAVSVGANYTFNKNVTFRPEVRYDWFDGTGLPFNAGTRRDQLVLSLGMIVQF